MSSTKAVASLLVGGLIDGGRVASVHEKVGTFIPEWSEGRRGRVEIEHILMHSSGLRRRWLQGESVGFETDKTGFVTGLVPEDEPGLA